MDKKAQLVETLIETLSRYGGKRAVKFILTSLGAMPFVEDIIEGSRDKLSDIEKQNLSDKLQEWIEFDNVDLSEALRILDAELKQPTKTNFSFLLWESLGIEIPFLVKDGESPMVFAILNPQTLNEFEQFEKVGLISIIPIEQISMAPGIKPPPSIEDKKRVLTTGVSVVIKLNQTFYQ
jgi:hypothetical protein